MFRRNLFYRGEKRSTWAVTLVLFLLVGVVILFFWEFYSLQRNVVYEKDGLYLDFSQREGETDDAEVDRATERREIQLLSDVEIVVDKTDYSAVVTSAGTGLRNIHGRFVPAESMTPTMLDGVTANIGGYDTVVLEVKPSGGVLTYNSAIPLAASYGVNGSMDLKPYVEKFNEKGIYTVAVVSGLVDSAMATRYGQIALKSAATGEVYTSQGYGWLDPYSDQVRTYISGLLEELKGMGFDEVLMTGIWCPGSELLQFSTRMTETPDTQSAVSSFALYLRRYAEGLDLKLSGMAEPAALMGGNTGALGQDLEVFFKAFDRVAFQDDGVLYATYYGVLADIAGQDAGKRVLPVCTGYAPDHESYIVK